MFTLLKPMEYAIELLEMKTQPNPVKTSEK